MLHMDVWISSEWLFSPFVSFVDWVQPEEIKSAQFSYSGLTGQPLTRPAPAAPAPAAAAAAAAASHLPACLWEHSELCKLLYERHLQSDAAHRRWVDDDDDDHDDDDGLLTDSPSAGWELTSHTSLWPRSQSKHEALQILDNWAIYPMWVSFFWFIWNAMGSCKKKQKKNTFTRLKESSLQNLTPFLFARKITVILRFEHFEWDAHRVCYWGMIIAFQYHSIYNKLYRINSSNFFKISCFCFFSITFF